MSKYQKRSGVSSKGIIALLVAAVLLVGVLCCGYASRTENGWFTNSDLATWHWSDKKPSEADKPNEPEEPEEEKNVTAVIQDIECNGVDLASAYLPAAAWESEGISEQAETAYVLNATVNPPEADSTVIWTAAWKDETAAWASGKTVTDYVTVTPSESTDRATVECMQPFGESIIVKVESVTNTEAFATCSVEYLRTLKSSSLIVKHDKNTEYDLTLNSSNAGNVINWNWQPLKSTYSAPNQWDDYTNVFEDEFTDAYTIEDTVESRSITVSASSALQTELDKVVTYASDRNYYKQSYTYTGEGFYTNCLTQRGMFGSYEYSQDGLFKFALMTYDDDGVDKDYMSGSDYATLATALKACSTDLIVTLTVNLKESGTYTFNFNVNILDSSLNVVATSVNTDSNKLIFGGK